MQQMELMIYFLWVLFCSNKKIWRTIFLMNIMKIVKYFKNVLKHEHVCSTYVCYIPRKVKWHFYSIIMLTDHSLREVICSNFLKVIWRSENIPLQTYFFVLNLSLSRKILWSSHECSRIFAQCRNVVTLQSEVSCSKSISAFDLLRVIVMISDLESFYNE